MKTKILLLLTFSLLGTPAAVAQTVTVTGKKITYTRPNPIAEHKTTFWVNHPVVNGPVPEIAERIQRAVSFESVIPLDLKDEINEIQWLEEADFEVRYNKNGALGSLSWSRAAGRTRPVQLSPWWLTREPDIG